MKVLYSRLNTDNPQSSLNNLILKLVYTQFWFYFYCRDAEGSGTWLIGVRSGLLGRLLCWYSLGGPVLDKDCFHRLSATKENTVEHRPYILKKKNRGRKKCTIQSQQKFVNATVFDIYIMQSVSQLVAVQDAYIRRASWGPSDPRRGLLFLRHGQGYVCAPRIRPESAASTGGAFCFEVLTCSLGENCCGTRHQRALSPN